MAEIYVSHNSSTVFHPELITFGSPGVNSSARGSATVSANDVIHFQHLGDPVTYAEEIVGGGGPVFGPVAKINLPEFTDGPNSLPPGIGPSIDAIVAFWVEKALQTEEHTMSTYNGSAIFLTGSPFFSQFMANPSAYHVVMSFIGSGRLDGGIMLLATLFGQFPFIEKLFADSAYQGPIFGDALAKILPGLETEIVKRSDQAKGFVQLPKRWIVERTIAWLNRCPPPCKGLGKSQPQCPRVLETRVHPPHVAKAL